MPGRVVLVLPVRTYRAAAFLDAARALGLEVVVASEHASTVAAGTELVVDLRRPEEAADAAARLAGSGIWIDGVIGVDESAVSAAAAIAQRLGLRHHSVAAVAATRDKRLLRRRLAAADVRQAAFAEVRTKASPGVLEGAAEAVGGFPVVAKPVGLAASQGVLRADGPAELVAAARRIGALLDRLDCDAGEDDHPLLVEEFLPGVEVAVEAIARDGHVDVLAFFDKPDPLDGPTFAETIYVSPSRLPAATQAAVTALVVTGVRALGLSDGPLHAEVRVDPLTGPALVEVAARSIGGMCSRAVRVCAADPETGAPVGEAMALEEVILLFAVGLPLAERLVPAPGARGVLMLPVETRGRLVSVDGVSEARTVPGVESVSLNVPRGGEVEPLPEGDRYLGFVVASGDHPLRVERSLRDAWHALDVRVEPPVTA